MKTAMQQPRGIQWTLMQKLEDLAFADDVGLMSHSFQHMQSKTETLHTTAKSTGLEINIEKTKTTRVNVNQEASIFIGGQALEDVDKFIYLGSIVIKTGGEDEDVKARIAEARHAFVTLKPIWRNKNIHLKTKLRLFDIKVKSVLLYGAQPWRHTKKLEHKLQVFVNSCLWQMYIRWPV